MTRARELAKLANSNVFSVDTNNNVGINSSTPDAKLDVVGVISATSFSGDGSNLTGIIAGATLNASSGTQRLVVTSQTTGSMTQAATSSDITYNTSTSTLSATQYSGNLSGNVTGLQGTPSITVQDITAEQISAAGTVTYSSVENVNSVGIITANKGIKVPNYGVNVTGVITATSFQGDGSQLSGVESGTQSFVASGTIANGDTVIINTDGTVGIVTQTTSNTPSVGSPGTYRTAQNRSGSAVYDSVSGKVIVAFQDNGNSNYGVAVVGTVSGDIITFGNPVTFQSNDVDYASLAYDSSAEKVVITYQRSPTSNVYDLRSIVGTVSGTSITFGSANSWYSAGTQEISSIYDPTSGKVIIVYREDNADGANPRAIVGTVSGTSISFGSSVEFDSGQYVQHLSITKDSYSNKIVIAFKPGGFSGGKVIIGTVSGTSISFGTAVTFHSGGIANINCTFDSNSNKVVIAYRDDANSSYGTAIVGTVSGTSISFGTAAVFESAATYNMGSTAITFDSNSNKIVIPYSDGGDSGKGKAVVGTVSGTSISFGSAVEFESGAIASLFYVSGVYDITNKKVIIFYVDDDDNDYGKAVVFSAQSQTTNLTSENYIGIAGEAIANGATGKITVVGGTNSGQTGLTTAKKYYVQSSGGISTSISTPSVVAGHSVSSTKIAVQKS